MLIILRHQSYSTSTHTNCLIQFVKERFDQVFRLNRGRAFYSSLSICQAVFEEFFVSSQPLALPTSLPISSAGGAFYSVQNRCQPPPSRAFDSGESKHRQSQTTTLSARRILVEFAADAIFYFVQLFDFQGVFREACTGRGAHYKDPERAVNCFRKIFLSISSKETLIYSSPATHLGTIR